MAGLIGTIAGVYFIYQIAYLISKTNTSLAIASVIVLLSALGNFSSNNPNTAIVIIIAGITFLMIFKNLIDKRNKINTIENNINDNDTSDENSAI